VPFSLRNQERLSIWRKLIRRNSMGGATGVSPCVCVGGGVNDPLTFETRGVQGVQRDGPMKMIFASTADSLYSVLYK